MTGRQLRGMLVVALAAVLAAGCNDDQDRDGEDHDAIAAVMATLRQAQDTGDAELACEGVYAIQEPGREGGGQEGSEEESEGEAEPEGENELEGEGAFEGEEEGEGGEECREAFEATRELERDQVSDLSTELTSVEVTGDSAEAIVHTELTRADGSPLSQDVSYGLVRTPEGWRIRISEEG